jgi:hypothetical protein
MIVGYSLSPGGLLFPYHIGVLTCLSNKGYLKDSNPIAGSSAGAIAVASHASKVKPETALEATIQLSDQCLTSHGSARGNLMPLLEKELDALLPENAHEILSNREAIAGLAYKEIFPSFRNVLETKYDSRDHVIDSVCNSAMFPFFTTNFPCRLSKKFDGTSSIPRLVVDGYFSVDRSRFGCPDFNVPHSRITDDDDLRVDRKVTISVFPHDTIALTASEKHDRISPLPEEDTVKQMTRLLRLATECGSRDDYTQLYEDGWKDAERWIDEEESRGYWGMDDEERRKVYAAALEIEKGLN